MLKRLFDRAMALVRAHPAYATGILNVIAVIGLHFGLNLAPDLLAEVVAGFNALLAILGRRAVVVPKATARLLRAKLRRPERKAAAKLPCAGCPQRCREAPCCDPPCC